MDALHSTEVVHLLTRNFCFFAASLLPALFAQEYNFQSLTIPGVDAVTINGINNRGAMVGSGGGGFKIHANGVLEHPLSYGRDGLSINDINNYGQMAATSSFSTQGLSSLTGVLIEADGSSRSFYLGPLEEPYTSVTTINDSGDFAGAFKNYLGRLRGFISKGGNVSVVHFPGAVDTRIRGIAADGTVVGCYNEKYPFLRGPKGNFLELSFPRRRHRMCSRNIERGHEDRWLLP